MALAGATILQVAPELASGGVERTTIEVAEAIVRAGGRALVASAGGRMEAELARAGGELVRLPTAASKNPVDILANAGRLKRLIRERDVKIVHARSRAPGWSAYWAAKGTGTPFVTTYHGIYNARTALKKWYNSVMARGDVIIANSEFTADHVRTANPDAADRVVAIPRGVDIDRFTPEAVAASRIEDLRVQWGMREPASGLTILLPARMTGWKGHRQAIAAASLLSVRDLPRWRMIFAGDPGRKENYVASLKEMLSQSRLDDKVTIVGHCNDMPAAFALADIVIAPSIEPEAFGRVAAEAGAMAAPVVASRLGGQKEVVVDGQTGFLVEPGDAAGLASSMEQLIRMGPDGRARIGAAAQARVREHYTTASLQAATLAVYERLLA
jgi:glycosyltransferase involved in cell wall biosynthesis